MRSSRKQIVIGMTDFLPLQSPDVRRNLLLIGKINEIMRKTCDAMLGCANARPPILFGRLPCHHLGYLLSASRDDSYDLPCNWDVRKTGSGGRFLRVPIRTYVSTLSNGARYVAMNHFRTSGKTKGSESPLAEDDWNPQIGEVPRSERRRAKTRILYLAAERKPSLRLYIRRSPENRHENKSRTRLEHRSKWRLDSALRQIASAVHPQCLLVSNHIAVTDAIFTDRPNLSN
jgi:hypothetical protein